MSAEVAHGTAISQAPSSVSHTNDPEAEESGESDEGTEEEETDEERILEGGDSKMDKRGKQVVGSIYALAKEEEDVKITIAQSLAYIVAKATTMTIQQSLGEASSSQVQDPATQLSSQMFHLLHL